MTQYYCKCGRKVSKSAKSGTTGNRDTAGCTGCPFLIPYGKYVFTDHGYDLDVQGYECRMTDHPTDYTTRMSSPGGPNDKTVLHIQSLDFDFLQTVTDWVRETFPDGELTGGFDRHHLRTVEFFDGYRIGFYPMQNRKGAAAKLRLFHHFFLIDGTRLDMTPEEEKNKILSAIEAGKAGHRKGENMTEQNETELTMTECTEIIKRIPTGYAFHQKFMEISAKADSRDNFIARILIPANRDFLFQRDFLGENGHGAKLSCSTYDGGVILQAESKNGTACGKMPFAAVMEILWPEAQQLQQYAGADSDPDNEKELGSARDRAESSAEAVCEAAESFASHAAQMMRSALRSFRGLTEGLEDDDVSYAAADFWEAAKEIYDTYREICEEL